MVNVPTHALEKTAYAGSGTVSWSFRSLCPARTSSGRQEAHSSSYQNPSQPERLCPDWKVDLLCSLPSPSLPPPPPSLLRSNLSRMQVTARFRCYSLHSRVFPCLLQSSSVSPHSILYQTHTPCELDVNASSESTNLLL